MAASANRPIAGAELLRCNAKVIRPGIQATDGSTGAVRRVVYSFGDTGAVQYEEQSIGS